MVKTVLKINTILQKWMNRPVDAVGIIRGGIYMGYYEAKVKRQVGNCSEFLGFWAIFSFFERQR
jgi:hypothetical protein